VKLIFALTAASLFGSGAYLLLNRDLVRVVLGVIVVSQATTLTLIASGLTRGTAPIYPLGRDVSDPMSQAMALTAIVIGLAVTALLLVLVLRVVLAYRSRDLHDVADEEADRDAGLERRHGAEHDAEEAAAR
jgi:multicomponent Na+:H+ antiporter subunit C